MVSPRLRPAAISALVLLTAAAAWPDAQTTRPPFGSGTASVTGTVVDAATQRPVDGAAVTIVRDDPRTGMAIGPRVNTAADGTFTIDHLPAATVRIESTKPGYVSGQIGKRRWNGNGVSVVLTDGAHLSDLRLSMWTTETTTARLSGAVKDDHGRPVANASVVAVAVDGTPAWTDRGPYPVGTTNTAGQFAIPVSPGTYAIEVRPGGTSYPAPPASVFRRAGAAFAHKQDVTFLTSDDGAFLLFPRVTPPSPTAGGAAQASGRTYLGGATMGSAQRIRVSRGETIDHLDVTMSPVPAVHLSGVVTGPKGPVQSAMLRLLSPDDDHLAPPGNEPTATSGADGRFDFVLVAAGHYVLDAYVRVPPLYLTIGSEGLPIVGQNDVISSDPDALWAQVPLDLDGDVRERAVVMRGGTRVTATFETDPPLSANELQRTLLSLMPVPLARGSFSARASGNRVEVLVTPGSYEPSVGLPPGAIVASMTVGGVDVLDRPLTIGETAVTDLIVRVARTAATVTGRVTTGGGEPAVDAAVVLFPIDRQAWTIGTRSPARVRLVRPTTGQYRFDRIPPGDYFLAAVDDATLEDWPATSVLDRLAAIATRVHLDSGETAAPELIQR